MKRLVFCLIVMLFSASVYASPIQWTVNGHYYEKNDNGVSWNDAKNAAETQNYLGAQGHLATITSAEESLWLYNTFGSGLMSHWIGAYYEKNVNRSEIGWKWISGEQWNFSNWAAGEPGALYGNESEISLSPMSNANGIMWWDLDGSQAHMGYMVEYGVPEPSSIAFLIIGFGLILKRRPKYRQTGDILLVLKYVYSYSLYLCNRCLSFDNAWWPVFY